MKLRWTERASADSLSVYGFIAERSEKYAESVYSRIVACPQQLVDHPRSGSIVPEFERDDIREVFVHSFRIVYRILQDEIHILTVIHGAHPLPSDVLSRR